MRFRLMFEGEIRPRLKAGLPHIHQIRQAFHPQLKRLWSHPPLSEMQTEWLRAPDPADISDHKSYRRIETVGGKSYAPLISHHLGAELDIIFLRHQAKGQLIGEGGDIDNRLKTLFDALRKPSKSEVQTLGQETESDEEPLHCLLRDDALIHRVNVETDRLLKDAPPNALVVIVNVKVVITRPTFQTLSFVVD
jgi:hypothetical protein